MKVRLLIILLFVLQDSLTTAQVSFEGQITYELTYEVLSEELKKIEKWLPYQVEFTASGTEYKMVSKIEGKEDQIELMNNFDGSGYRLMNFLGYKIALKNEVSEVRKTHAEYFKAEVEQKGEEKETLGFSCKSAQLVLSNDTIDVFYTDQYVSPDFKYVNVKGLPLEYTIRSKDIIVKANAVFIESREIDSYEFSVPSAYKVMTIKEMQEMFEM